MTTTMTTTINDDFGKVDWDEWEQENDDFGKVDWKLWEKENDDKYNWTTPEDGLCDDFYFYGTLYLRDSNDVIWKNETDKNGFPLEMVGWFNKELGIIDDQMIIQVID